MTVLEIEFADGSSEALNVIGAVITKQWKEQSRASIEVFRDEWQSLVDTIDKINDEFYISVDGNREFGGRLVNYSNEEDSVNLEIGSFEEDAITAQPTDPTEEFITSDSEIVNDAISRIPNLSAGVVDTISTNIGFVFSNSSPAKMIRDCQSTTVAFVSYNPDKTIDYKEFPTGDEPVATIGPGEGNVQDDFTVIENEREEFTHIRVLGAGEGDGRIQAEGSVSDVSGREKWGKFSNTDITSQSRANEVLNNLLEEYEENPIRKKVETTVFGVELEVGSKVEVVSEVDSINEEMFVTKLERLFEGSRLIYNATLSNRLISEEDRSKKRRQSVENFDEGYQGQIVTINSGGYRAPIDSGVPYEFSVRVPDDVVEELTAEIEIESLPYRSYVSGAGHSHEFEVPEHAHDFSIDTDAELQVDPGGIEDSRGNLTVDTINDSTWTDLFTINVGSNSNFVSTFVNGYYPNFEENDDDPNVYYRAIDEEGNTFPDDGGTYTRLEESEMVSWTAALPVTNDPEGTLSTQSVSSGGDVTIQALSTTSEINWDLFYSYTAVTGGVPTYTVSEATTTESGGQVSDTSEAAVGFEPGVNVFEDESPSNVSISIDGTEVVSNVGSGEFNEVVDIGGFLDEGFNTVSIESDTLGHMRATAFIDVFRQITQ